MSGRCEGKPGLFKEHISLKGLTSVKATRHFRMEATKLGYGDDSAWPNVSSHLRKGAIPDSSVNHSARTMTINNDYQLWLFRDVDFQESEMAERHQKALQLTNSVTKFHKDSPTGDLEQARKRTSLTPPAPILDVDIHAANRRYERG